MVQPQVFNSFGELDAIGNIAISLAQWEMTGLDNEIRDMTASEQAELKLNSVRLRRH